MLVDSHCHLNFPELQDQLPDVLRRAKDAGVGVMQTICTKMSEFDDVLGIADAHDNIYCSVGVHPHYAEKDIVATERLVECAKNPKVIGIGETGLDFYYNNSDEVSQGRSFRAHIAASRETGLPVIVHTRSADDKTIEIIEDEMKQGVFKGLIHCFSTSRELAEKALENDFYISISGIITFKKSEELREIVADIPLERLLIETDAPYLAPVPNRGKTNEPSFVKSVAKKIAEVKNIEYQEVMDITSSNFFKLFDKVSI